MRFAVEDPAKVTSPPYDLISDADVEVLLDSHPNNVVRLILPCSSASNSSPPATPEQPTAGPARPAPGAPPHFRPDPTSPTGEVPLEARYAEARDTLKAWLDSGVLVPDDVPALYVYEQTGPNVLQRGLIGDVGLADPAQRIILPHEDVLPGPIADRLALMSTTQANLEPIFLLYEGAHGTATAMVDEVAATRSPLVTARTEDGLTHRLWAITNPTEIEEINADLRHRQALIADGHHRYATYRVLQRQERAAHHPAPPPPNHPEPTHADSPEPAHPHGPGPIRANGPEPTYPDGSRLTHPDGPEPTHPDDSELTHPDDRELNHPGHREPTHLEHPTRPEPTHSEHPTRLESTHADHPEPLQPTHPDRRGTRATGPIPGPWDFGLALLVDSNSYPPDLQAIHRVIPGLPLGEATARAKGSWHVHDYEDLAHGLTALERAAEPAFLLAGEGGSHLLTDPDPIQLARAMPPDHSDRWNALNTSILTEFILPVVWGMRDDDQTVRIVHHDPEAAARLATRTGGTAVILKPLVIEDVLAVAAGGERVPRKSTSFGPKPRTGLVMRTFATD